MVLDCKVCGVTTITTYICSDCNVIKDCCNLYTHDVVIEVLKKVLIRDDKQRQFKIDKSNEEADTEDHTHPTKKEERKSERLKDKVNK